MADEVASLLVRITADGSQAVGVLNGVASTIGTLADKNATLLNKVSSVGTLAGTVGKTITKTFGVATVAGLTASANAAGKLNKELANIGTLSVPTERLQQFKGQIQDIAIAAGKNTSDISEGTYQVISAFGDAADTMEKVEINAKAAKAGLATTADSIALTSAVTKAYGDTSAKAVQHVADLAFKTVELGQTTFPELAQSMQQVTSISKQLGVSQEELFASYATLTGVTGNASEVQTQLKAVYNALLKPSEKMEQAIHNIGYESGYTMINTLGLAGTLDALVKATDGSDEALLSLFNNQRALPAILALTGAQADVFSEKLTKMKDASGAATKAFEIQTEGVAKTGFTLEQAKVKMQVAAQKFGESAAPLMGDVADVVDRASTALSGLTEEQRKSIINTGVMATKTGIVLSAGGKAVTLGTKFVGTIKAVAPALASVASAAGPAALGIAGVTTAVVAGKKAYDHWYDSKYKFAETLKGETENLKQSYDAWKELNDLQREYNDFSGKISKGELEGKELEQAKSRLEEIKNILKEKYKIDLDSGDIDSAIEKAKELSKLDFYNSKNKLQNDINDLQEPYEKAIKNLPELQAQYNTAKEKAESYNGTLLKLAEARDKFNNGAADSIAYTKEFAAALNELGKKTGDGDTYGDRLLKEYEKLYGKGNTDNLYGFAALQLSSRISELDIEGLSEKISQYTQNIDLYKEAVKGLADINVLQLGEAIKSGGDTEQYISAIKKYIDAGVLSADEYSKKIAQIQTGFSGIEQAMKGNDLTGYLNTYISDMHEFGQSTEQVASGIGNMLSGIDFSKLDTSQIQQIQTALSKLKGMENIKINVNANGDVSIIDEATGKVQILQASGNVSIDIQENGDIHVLNEAGEVIEKLKANQNVSLQVAAKADGTQDLEAVNKITEALKQNGNVEVTVTANDDGTTTISTIQKDIDNLKQNSNVDVTVTAKANSGNILTDIKDFLFPTAAAAEIEVPVTAKAGEVDASSITADVIDKVNGTEIPDTATKTLGIVVEPGNIDVSAVNSAVESSVGQIAQGNTSIDVTVTATTAGLDAVQALSTAITNVSGKTVSAKAEVTGKSDVDDLRESINLLRGKTVDVSANVRGISDVNALKNAIDSVKSKTVTVKAVTKEVKQNAKGTQNFSGGLAMVNDQKGISDPRELIIDRGRAFIPEGRNVILSLSKGAKVYTASQTKAIMSSMGIPHYAEGKDNSDTFKAARDAWTHTTRIRAVTVTEELEKWVELSGKFKGNIKDAEDIEEEIFNSVRASRDELNEQSEDYILDRAELNDWESWGDTAVSAFDRVRERENKYVAEGKITAKEADSYLVDLGENMYDARIANSKAWLEHEEKYNNMAVENYIAGLDRMAAYTDEYYAKGIITAKEYRISMQEISDLKADKIKEANNAEYEAWKKDAAQYRKRAENYGWGFDSELEYLERYRAKIKKFYDDGKISFEEYIYDYQDAQMEWYQKQSDTYDAMLRNAEKYVDTIEENQNQAKDAFEDKWNMAKLDDNIKEQTELVKLYNGAVTARGKEALKTANDKLADYRHEKAAYELEQRQAAELERLRRDYNRLEIGKKTYLAAISGSTEAAERYIKALNKIPEDMRYIMGELLTAIRNIKVQGGNTSTYGDTHYNIQMPNIEGNFINKLNRALGGY